jgi:3-deoxy-D-manno-octulosonate 8-phosphate phosphatase KdsC-like HAD superfamily phosphatase
MNDITTFIFDVDGVLTDGSVFKYTEPEQKIARPAMKATYGPFR